MLTLFRSKLIDLIKNSKKLFLLVGLATGWLDLRQADIEQYFMWEEYIPKSINQE